MTFETLTLDMQGPVAVLTLDRPERLNAIDQRMIAELNAALDQAEANQSARALVVHGAGRAFSAGFDLKESAQLTRKGEADWRPVFEADLAVIMRFWHSPLPTISAVHGACLAGACELALACDITVAAEDARFGEPELKFGAGVVALLLPWLTGPKQAKELLLTGNDRISAAEALRIGLINRVVPEGQHLETALQIARTMAVMDRDALRMTKQAINRGYEIMGLAEALAAGLESGIGIACLDTPERREFDEIARKEGLKAALAWRESRFE